MEDLATEFLEDFLSAVKVLEDFSSSDASLKEAMREIRDRVNAKKYVCAPNFWQDLKDTLGAIEKSRADRGPKSKASQVLKQVVRLEVNFYAKEESNRLRELDPQFRLEGMVEWLRTFGSNSSSVDQAVLYQVISDLSLQKDMENHQRDALAVEVRDNLHKFPGEMQAVLEQRLIALPTAVTGANGISDWRRRNQVAQPEAPSRPGTNLNFVPVPRIPIGLGPSLDGVPLMAPITPGFHPAGPAMFQSSFWVSSEEAGRLPGHEASPAPWRRTGNELDGEEALHDEEEAAPREPFDISQVDAEQLQKARTAVTAMLQSSDGECEKRYVKALLKQVGVTGMPMSALGEGVFCSGTEVFLRRPTAYLKELAPPAKEALPEELSRHMVEVISEAGGRMALKELMEKLQWQPGSARYKTYGLLKRAIGQVKELFYEPEKVYSLQAACGLINILAPPEEKAIPAEVEVPASEVAELAPAGMAVAFVSDPFAELIATILAWIQQANGSLRSDAVEPLIKAMGFKVRAVTNAIADTVFWSHASADCNILLRTTAGIAAHLKPLPPSYLHEQVLLQIIGRVKGMGALAKVDKLAGAMGWNLRSELAQTYGALHVVLRGLREVFFDPTKLWLKSELEGLVEWPGKAHGAGAKHWTPAADDLKQAGDPDWLALKRQIIGTVMFNGGRCQALVLRALLQTSEGASLEMLFQPDSKRSLREVLFWETATVFPRRPDALLVIPELEAQAVPASFRQVAVDAVRERGSMSTDDLKAQLKEVGVLQEVPEEQFLTVLQLIPELFFMPEVVFLRYVAMHLMCLQKEEPEIAMWGEDEAAGDDESRAAAAAAEAEKLLLATAANAQAESLDGAEGSSAASDGPFFSFSDFSAASEASSGSRAAKRPRLGSEASVGSAWTTVPSWVVEGAAVLLRVAGEANTEATILQVEGTQCRVRIRASDPEDDEERVVDLPALVPVLPTVGTTVKVVGGDRTGCYGTLVGLAGVQGVVQLNKMSYETLPMSQLVAVST